MATAPSGFPRPPGAGVLPWGRMAWESPETDNPPPRRDDVLVWLAARRARPGFAVERIPFVECEEWCFDDGQLRHVTGRFFSVIGLSARSRFPGLENWEQPIIDQPEVGILGFLARRRQGAWQLLAQAKAEPGNVGVAQLAPTVQATESNYTGVHGGKRPPYLDFFLGADPSAVLVDQLQSEQGSRFLRKRNRNVVVVVPSHLDIEHDESFRWTSLTELRGLMRMDNVVNTDARSVIASLPLGSLETDPSLAGLRQGRGADDFHRALEGSLRASQARRWRPLRGVLAWITQTKLRYGLQVQRLPLQRLQHWRIEPAEIRHVASRFFSIFPIAVRADDREVARWSQPIVHTAGRGLVGLLCQRQNGVLHFLVQARVEPGCFDVLELTATVQCVPAEHTAGDIERCHPFFAVVADASPGRIRVEVTQSDEGGRFFRDESRYMLVEAGETERFELPANYCWVTLGQLKSLIRFNNLVTNELRSLIACLILSA